MSYREKFNYIKFFAQCIPANAEPRNPVTVPVILSMKLSAVSIEKSMHKNRYIIYSIAGLTLFIRTRLIRILYSIRSFLSDLLMTSSKIKEQNNSFMF